MTEEHEKLLLSIEELKVKIPSLLDLIDEIISHETRFKSIDEKTDVVIEQLKKLRTTLQDLNLDHKKFKELTEDDRNVSAGIAFLEEMLKRKDVAVKKYIKECFCSEEVGSFIGEAVLKNKEDIANYVWNSLETKLKLYIGTRVIAGGVSIGVILGIIFMVVSFIQKYF